MNEIGKITKTSLLKKDKLWLLCHTKKKTSVRHDKACKL